MVRGCHAWPGAPPGCPPASGDGPARRDYGCSALRLSPREWGWSGVAAEGGGAACVVPTRVGMVRRLAASGVPGRSCPHASGDGPGRGWKFRLVSWLSPREWGWSARAPRTRGTDRVVPTRVGMVRVNGAGAWAAASCPHASGDGPRMLFDRARLSRLSPREWGWSASTPRYTITPSVVPTRVGMVRCQQMAKGPGRRCPHASGDGPEWVYSSLDIPMLSPREWGWSVYLGTEPEGRMVVPTRVGMVRAGSTTPRRQRSCPHASGDGPRWHTAARTRWKLSPREWGWSAVAYTAGIYGWVVPTRVGMVRQPAGTATPPPGCPHASGDGPAQEIASQAVGRLSPREWGWSVLFWHADAEGAVVPTRVGMVQSGRTPSSSTRSCPHASGDGPYPAGVFARCSRLSPREWGWSAVQPLPVGIPHVVPTREGKARDHHQRPKTPLLCCFSAKRMAGRGCGS